MRAQKYIERCGLRSTLRGACGLRNTLRGAGSEMLLHILLVKDVNPVPQFNEIFATFELIGWVECITVGLNGRACARYAPSMHMVMMVTG